MAATSPSPPKATRPRHLLRYSLRGLLIFLTLACVGVWYWYRVPYKKEVLHPKGLPLWQEKSGFIRLAKEEQRYRRVLRGEPIREGRTEWFDVNGRRICEERWLEGRPHGVWLQRYTSGRVRLWSEYALGRRLGTWERFDETGQLTVRMPFDNGDPHGLWEWFDNGKLARTIRFDHTEVLQIDDRPINDPLGRACRLGKIDNYVIRDMLSAFGVCDFRNTPLKDVVDFISENYAVSMAVDRHSLQNVGVQVDTPITLQEDQVTTGAMLVLLFEPHDLAATYRFGMIWITTKDNARNWVDRTGIAELLKSPPAEILPGDHDKIRAALEESAQFDFVETPLQRVAESLSDYHRVPFDCDPTIKDMLLESYFRGLSLQNALGALCDQYGLRIRWKDGNTLVIEPQEGAENWRPRR